MGQFFAKYGIETRNSDSDVVDRIRVARDLIELKQ